MSMNKAIICGRLGADPEIRSTSNGTMVANFRVATEENWTDKQGQRQKRTEWHRMTAWGKLAEIVGEYSYKGREVLVEGMLRTNMWEDKNKVKHYTTNIQAQKVTLMGAFDKSKKSQTQSKATEQKKVEDVADEYTGNIADDADAQADAWLRDSDL